MTEEFRRKLDAKLNTYRDWLRTHNPARCRRVQYCGIELVGASDVPIDEVESRIYGLLCEGFYVDWSDRGDQIVLRIWEFGGPEPDWQKVFNEQHIRPLPKDLTI
jgi:hypothetical protein